MPEPTTHSFVTGGQRLVFDEYGSGDRVVVLTHGQLMTRRMQAPLASALADAGYRVVNLDLLGHGDSDRPTDSWRYSMTAWAVQVVALLDHLEIDRAVIGGTSLGANVSLEVAVSAPERVTGLVIEMPVLDHAIVAGLIAFAPLLFAARFTPPVVSAVNWAAGRVPTGHPVADIVTETLRQRPAAMAAVVAGIFAGRIAPPKPLREQIQIPTLVIGHRKDPVHPFADADMLAGELVSSTFVEARSPLELRLRPQRLTEVIAGFLADRFAGSNPQIAV